VITRNLARDFTDATPAPVLKLVDYPKLGSLDDSNTPSIDSDDNRSWQ